MRYLAQIEGKQRAEAFVAYLLTQSISTHIEAVPDNQQMWDVWIRDEDKLSRASAELKQFSENPSDPKYSAAVNEARQILKQKQEAAQAAAKNVRKVQYRSLSPLTSGPVPPLTLTLMILCVAVSLITNFMEPNYVLGERTMETLTFASIQDLERTDGDPAASLKRGEIWRTVTPVFLHAFPLHLAMNMLGLLALGRVTERLVGTPRYAIMILLLAMLPMMLACLMRPEWDGSPRTVGISGVVYGLAAYLWVISSQRPDLGFRIPGAFIGLLVMMIVLGFIGVLPGMSNWGHLGGFVVGLGMAAASTVGPR